MRVSLFHGCETLKKTDRKIVLSVAVDKQPKKERKSENKQMIN